MGFFDAPPLVQRYGCVLGTTGNVARVSGLDARVGDVCEFFISDSALHRGEVIALDGPVLIVWVDQGVRGLSAVTRVRLRADSAHIPVGQALMGRILDAYGQPLDGLPAPVVEEFRTISAETLPPMRRARIERPFITGVKVLDGLCTLGVGQRVGIMAPAGVGKSTLLGMLARFCDAQVNVIALIGERGRELREFVEDALGEEGLARSVVICATSDRSPLDRHRAALVATTIAEFFRDQGKSVFLMVDSLTRFARAQRELGLAQGEMPTRRGYPSSLFAALPRLLERAGPGLDGSGSITAVYTVLMEDAESSDPVAEEVKSLLDGHLVLSGDLAARGHFPALDVRFSISRLMTVLVDDKHLASARKVRRLLDKHAEIMPLIQMGEFQRGTDEDGDMAMDRIDSINSWLSQTVSEPCGWTTMLNELFELAE